MLTEAKSLGIDFLIFQNAESEVATREARMLDCSARVKSLPNGPEKVNYEVILIDLIDAYLAAVDRVAMLILRGTAPTVDYRHIYEPLMKNCENTAPRRFGPDPVYKNITALNKVFQDHRS